MSQNNQMPDELKKKNTHDSESEYSFELTLSDDVYNKWEEFITDFQTLKQNEDKADQVSPNLIVRIFPDKAATLNTGEEKEYEAILNLWHRYDFDKGTFDDKVEGKLTIYDITEPGNTKCVGPEYTFPVSSMEDLFHAVNNLPLENGWKVNLKKDDIRVRLNNWYEIRNDKVPFFTINKPRKPEYLKKGTAVKVTAEKIGSRGYYHRTSKMRFMEVETKEGKLFVVPENYLSNQNINHLMEKAPLTDIIKNAEEKRETAAQIPKEKGTQEISR